MGPLALLNHAINFLAPALWLALLMPLLVRIIMKKSTATHTLPAQAAINFIVCCLVLIAGLVLFGRDGKMLTYLGLVVMAATTQWWLHRR
jgi:hypothetical protein